MGKHITAVLLWCLSLDISLAQNGFTVTSQTDTITVFWDSSATNFPTNFRVDIGSALTCTEADTSPCELSGLTPGSRHLVVITNTDTNTNIVDKSQYTAPLPPSALTIIKATTNPTRSLVASWTADANNAAGVEYRIRLDKGGTWGTVLNADTTSSHTFSDLVPGGGYIVYVWTRAGGLGDGAEESDRINSGTIYTQPKPPAGVTLVSTNGVTDRLTAFWTAASNPANDAAVKYMVVLYEGNTQIDTHTADTTGNYIFQTLSAATQYTLKVWAFIQGQTSEKSEEITDNSYTAPSQPAITSVLAESTKDLTVMWTHLTGVSYDVKIYKYSMSQVTETACDNIATSPCSIDVITVFTSVTPGQKYVITLIAIAGDGTTTSTASTEVEANTMPQKITTITATTLSPHAVQVTWVSNTNSIQDSYLISYKGEFVETSWTTEISVIDTRHLFENLLPGERYTFKVKPVSNGKIGADNTATTVTTPYNPQGLKVSTGGILPVSLTIEWQYDSTLSYNTGWRVTLTPDGADVIVVADNLPVSTLSTTINNLTPGQHYTIMVQGRTVDNIINSTGTEMSSSTKPVLVSNIQIADTTTTTMTVVYNEDTSGNVFDDYIFTLGAPVAENMTKIKAKEDMDREVLFDNLVPGTVYTLTTAVQSGTENSDAQIIRNMTVPPTPTLVCQELRLDYITVRISHQTGLVDTYMVNCEQCAVSSQTSEADGDPVDITFSGLDAYVDHTFIGIAKRNEGEFNKQSSTGQVICKTEESVPHAVENFIHNDETIKPYEVTLTWDDPTVSTGVLTEFLLEWSGTKANRPLHEKQLKTLAASVHTTTIDNLRAGYTYTFTIYAAVSLGRGAPRSINVVTPILVPYIELPEEQARPTVAQAVGDKDKPIDWNQVRVVLTNPFSNRDSEVVSFSVIIIDVTDNPPESSYEREIQESWYDIQNSDPPPPYKAFDKCTTLFSDGNKCLSDGSSANRQKRLVEPGTQTTITLGSDSKCKDKRASVNYCNGPLRGETKYRILLRGYNENGEFTNGYISEVIITEAKSTNLVVIIAPVIVIVLVVIAGGVLLVLYRKGYMSQNKKDTHEGATDSPPVQAETDVPHTYYNMSQMQKPLHPDVSETCESVDIPEPEYECIASDESAKNHDYYNFSPKNNDDLPLSNTGYDTLDAANRDPISDTVYTDLK